jgi:2-polyprenyl-3-methyl-5-hydroxy-6-metoxy-1,4-benzoquinol methylase
VSEAAIEQTSQSLPQVDFAYHVGPLQRPNRRPFPKAQFDLIVAIEVLMHIPPTEVLSAINNLVGSLRPPTPTTPGGHLITCDWSQHLKASTPIRNQNFCHAYPALFSSAKIPVHIERIQPIGLQTLFVVTRT